MRRAGAWILLIVSSFSLANCGEREPEVTISETRELTTKDQPPKLFATDDERFRNAKPGPLRADAPESWLTLPPSQFRQLNYRFGSGEVYASIAGGSLLDNVNRWLGQFGRPPLSMTDFSQLEKVPLLGTQGVWIEAEGTYASGMGQPPREGYALAGILADVGGRLVTVKMVGPVEEVAAERERLRDFAASLSFVD